MINPFKYVNFPIFIVSWLGFLVLSFLVLPSLKPEDSEFNLVIVGIGICFIVFMFQCVRGFFKMTSDASKGHRLPNIKNETQRMKIMFNPFKYVNIPLFIISWIGYGIVGFLVLPRFEPGSTGFVVGVVLAVVFFISFAIQCMKGFFGIMRDAKKGAELREKEERENS